jgi:copper transport protein
VAALLLVLSMAFAGGEARAHAVLQSSMPAADSIVPASPQAIALNFNEPVQVLALRIIDGEGRDLTPANPPVNADGRVILSLDGGLPDGRYLLSWRVSSLDSHVVAGSFTFTVGAAIPATPPAVTRVGELSAWPLLVLRTLSRVTLLLAVGITLFHVLLAPPWLRLALQSTIVRLSAGACVAHLLLAGGDGALRAGLEVTGLLTIDAWRAALASPMIWLQAATLIGLLLLLTARHSLVQLLGALLSLATLATSGHVLAELPNGIGQALVAGHGLVAALWIGAIWPLRVALTKDAGPVTARLFLQFQTYGTVAVLGVLSSGTAMAWLLLPRLSDLWESNYGVRLSAKLAAVAVMLLIALLNRAWLTRLALSGSARMRQRLATILGLDLAVALLAVALAAGLSLGPPPMHSLTFTLPGERYTIELAVNPGKIGDNSAEIILLPVSGAPSEPKAVELRISSPEADLEAATYPAVRTATGRWHVSSLPLWIGGPWRLRIGVLIDDFTKQYWETELTLQR